MGMNIMFARVMGTSVMETRTMARMKTSTMRVSWMRWMVKVCCGPNNALSLPMLSPGYWRFRCVVYVEGCPEISQKSERRERFAPGAPPSRGSHQS